MRRRRFIAKKCGKSLDYKIAFGYNNKAERGRNRIKTGVKVILLEEVLNVEANERNKSDLLLPPILDTRGWKFDREEANER